MYRFYLEKERTACKSMTDNFDIVFSFDTTGSMYSCLTEVRQRLEEMVKELNKIPGLRIAIFAHGDYCDINKKSKLLGNYITKYVDFTNDPVKLCAFVKGVLKTYGGDWRECYELVMREVQECLDWGKDSQKALVLIGDSLPHEQDETQNYRHLNWKEETTRLRDLGVKIYAVQCKGNKKAEYFYQYIASKTFGYYMPLDNFDTVKQLLISICYREAGLETVSSCSPMNVPSPRRPSSPVANTFGEIYDDDDDNDEFDLRLKCLNCKLKKPQDEFPSVPVSKLCEHYPGVCLRCVVKYVSENSECPQDGCKVNIDDKQSLMQVEIFKAILNTKFQDYSVAYEANRKALLASKGNVLTVSSVTGDTCWIDYSPTTTIQQIKQAVKGDLGIEEKQQRLLYKEKILKVKKPSGQLYTLQDYKISNNTSLNLIVPLYCIPDDLDHVVFDLSWKFPESGADFLDASCLVFSGTEFIQVIDWNHSDNDYYLQGAVKHTAKNEITNDGRTGHQAIHVHLKKVPKTVSHMYFTLSSWKGPTLSSFSNPRLQFYEASAPDINLCGTTFKHALDSQAVIMCSLFKMESSWHIFECDSVGCVNGNTKKYNPLRERIAELISKE